MMSRMKSRPASATSVAPAVMLSKPLFCAAALRRAAAAAYVPNPHVGAKTPGCHKPCARRRHRQELSIVVTSFPGPMVHGSPRWPPHPGAAGNARRTGKQAHRGHHERDRRHPLCAFAHRLSPYRRGPYRAVQLALCARPRRQDAAADRGYRPRTLDPGGDRRHPGRPDLVGDRVGRRYGLPVLPLLPPSRDRRRAAGRGSRLPLLRDARGACRDARGGAPQGQLQAL